MPDLALAQVGMRGSLGKTRHLIVLLPARGYEIMSRARSNRSSTTVITWDTIMEETVRAFLHSSEELKAILTTVTEDHTQTLRDVRNIRILAAVSHRDDWSVLEEGRSVSSISYPDHKPPCDPTSINLQGIHFFVHHSGLGLGHQVNSKG